MIYIPYILDILVSDDIYSIYLALMIYIPYILYILVSDDIYPIYSLYSGL